MWVATFDFLGFLGFQNLRRLGYCLDVVLTRKRFLYTVLTRLIFFVLEFCFLGLDGAGCVQSSCESCLLGRGGLGGIAPLTRQTLMHH